MVDCSHANSSKDHYAPGRRRARHRGAARGRQSLHLRRHGRKPSPGRGAEVQRRQGRPDKLAYGQSITDACLGWDDSVRVLEALSEAVARRARARHGRSRDGRRAAARSTIAEAPMRHGPALLSGDALLATGAGRRDRRLAGASPLARGLPRMTDGPFYPSAVLPRARARLGRRPDHRARPRPRRPAAAARARRAPRPARRGRRTATAAPIDGAEVEIWQCDAFGSYRHPRGAGDRIDAGFQGFGSTRSDAAAATASARSGRCRNRAHAAHPRQAAPSDVRRSHLAALRRRRARQRRATSSIAASREADRASSRDAPAAAAGGRARSIWLAERDLVVGG